MSNAPPEELLHGTFFWILVFAILSVVFHYVAKRRGLFLTDEGSWDGPHWRLWQVLLLFLVYIFATQMVAPAVFFFVVRFAGPISVGTQIAILQWVSVGFTALLLWLFSITLAKGCFSAAWKNDRTSSIGQDIVAGALFWIVGLPVVFVTMQVFELITYYAFGSFGVEQVSVRYLRESLSDPFLFGTALVAIILGAPFIEEYLFRGCLQGWLRNKVGVKPAIVIASIIFAGFHYAPGQKFGNIPILISLFVFSLYLGWAYEKQRSLWASITTHFIFNTVSVLYILNSGAAA